jgi:hypothetical protein
MPPKLTLLALTALTALACTLPAAVAAAEIVPPGNSAVNQYTETFPTSKGEEKSELEKNTTVTPGDVLGAGKAHKLEDKGAAGKAVAQFTAETAPTTSSGGSSSDNGESAADDNGGGKGNGNGEGKKPNTGGNGQNGGGDEPQESSAAAGGSTNAGSGGGPSGSSGVGEVVSQATGTASDSVSLWLPLILIAVVIWSAAYVWRNRQQRVA